MLAVPVLLVVLSLLAAFQAALALGAPWGRFAWGGRHDGTLPPGLRAGSAVSLLLYAVIAVVVLDASGATDLLPDPVVGVAMWVVVAFFALGVLANATSRSRPERVTMTPISVVLTGLALVIAL